MEDTKFIDTHAHIFSERIDFDSLDLSDVEAVLVPSYSMQNILIAYNFCIKHANCYLAVGVHPDYISDYDEQRLDSFISQHRESVYAIGEVGLDSNSLMDYSKQKNIFISQIQLSQKYDLPLSIHLRTKKDFNEFFEMLKIYPIRNFALHCFNGDADDLEKALALGAYISFATNITYKGNVKLRELCAKVPLDRLLIETDSPNMLPAIFARKGVNTPQNVIYVAQTISQKISISMQKIAEITSKNAKKLFKF